MQHDRAERHRRLRRDGFGHGAVPVVLSFCDGGEDVHPVREHRSDDCPVPQVHARDAADGHLTSGIGVRQGFILAIRDHCDAEFRGFLDRFDFAQTG
jgi:hypothetical protein